MIKDGHLMEQDSKSITWLFLNHYTKEMLVIYEYIQNDQI